MQTTQPEDLACSVVLGVSASWHQSAGVRGRQPVHVWVRLEDVGTYRLHTSGDGSLGVSAAVPSDGYDMEQYGLVVVDPGTPTILAERVGQRIGRVGRLRQDPPGMEVGVALLFGGGAMAIANLGDELIIGEWPSDMWSGQDLSEATRA